ncbi:MAG: chemotaxis protein [Candidatus Velthaea sp.]
MRDQPFFVSVATVAASLGQVRRIARELSLAAINAKVIALRAGSQAAGFRPITDFIDETARATAKLGNAIEAGTLAVSRSAVSERRSAEALRRLRRAATGSGSAAKSLDAVIERCDAARIVLSESVTRSIRSLDNLLDEIDAHMRSISVITVQSRVEARQAGAYRVDLEAVAASMSGAAEQVTAIVQQSRRDLRDAIAARANQRTSV